MDVYKAERVAHDIPLDHFDYHYVSKCNNVKELEKMLKVLRGGSIGVYPDLQNFIEQKLTSMAPKSKVLRKSEKLKSVKDLGSEEASEILGDMENWTSQIKTAEGTLKTAAAERGDDNLPPIRGASERIPVNTGKEAPGAKPKQEKKNKKAMPRSYKEWDRIDVDAELAKVDNDEVTVKENKNAVRKSKKPKISTTVDTTGLTDEEKEKVAEREKNKGNEAFRSGDYDEALLYYNRSISVVPSIPAINNRAQTYVKLKKWDDVIRDCCAVLQEDPDNVKALLRRVVALQGKNENKKAKVDLEHVLKLEANNKRAQDLLAEVDAAIAEQKKKGRRMVIVDEEGSDEDGDDGTEEKKDEEKAVETEEPSISEVLNISKKGKKVLIEEMPEAENKESSDEKNSKGKKSPKKQDSKKSLKKEMPASKIFEAVPESRKDKAVPEEKNEMDSDKLDARIKKAQEEKARMEEKIMQSKKEVVEAQAQLEKKKAELESAKKSVDDAIGKVTEAQSPEIQTPVKKPPASLPPALVQLKDEGKELFTRGQYGEAAAKYSKIIEKLKKDPNHAENLALIYSNRAACYSKTGDSKKCVEDCSASLEILPGALKPLIRRAQAYEAMERYAKAYMDYSEVFCIDSSIDSVVQGKNRCMKTLQDLHGPKWRNKLPAAQPITRGLTSSQPIKMHETTSVAQSEKSSQSESTVPEEESTLSEKLEKEFEKLNDEGRKFVQKQDFKNAVEMYAKCIKLCPHKTVAYTNRALCNIRLKQPEKVLEDCSSALRLEPDNIKALFRRAQASRMLENYESSKADLEKLLQLDPKNSSAKQELQQVNTHIENKKNTASQKPEKKQKKIEILEVDDDSDDEEDIPSRMSENIPEAPSSEDKTSAVRTPGVGEDKKVESVPSSTNTKTEEVTEVATEEKSADHQNKETKQEFKSEDTPSSAETAENEELKQSSTPGKLKTAYEFIQAWTSLKRCTDPAPYVKLMEQIEPQDMPKVISNKLDSNMLKMIIKCIEVFIDRGQLSQSLAYLQHLPSVPRFQVITMFMSSQEKADLGYLLTKLEELGHCKYLTADLKKLRKIYGLV